MKIKELLTHFKQALPYIGLSLGVQNFLMAKEAKAARLQTTVNETTKLLAELKAKHEVIIAKQAMQNKIAGLSADASDHFESSNYHSRIIDGLVERLKNNCNIDQREHDFIIGLIHSNTEKKIESLEKANSILRDINDLIFFSNSPINNYIDQLKIWIEKYKTFLSWLDVEHFLPLLNIIGLMGILLYIISIVTIFYSDYLIKHFKLELKYPKIAKFIQLRRQFQWYYFNLNILLILGILILLFWFNIDYFIFTLKYYPHR